ncbi:hypothetical protein LTS15_003017 [Exophiala xenobiotica]|jgi:hypothetical protein|nr:hypothetical protein LTS15_003017 [Exophiala xenobiotica]
MRHVLLLSKVSLFYCCGSILLCDPEVENVSPMNAWNYLEKEYKMDDKLAFKLAHVKACSLRLQDCENMTDYLNQHKLLYHDFTDAGGTQDFESFLYGIVSGLGVKYTHFLQRDDIEVLIEMGDIATLTGKLLLFESENWASRSEPIRRWEQRSSLHW